MTEERAKEVLVELNKKFSKAMKTKPVYLMSSIDMAISALDGEPIPTENIIDALAFLTVTRVTCQSVFADDKDIDEAINTALTKIVYQFVGGANDR